MTTETAELIREQIALAIQAFEERVRDLENREREFLIRILALEEKNG